MPYAKRGHQPALFPDQDWWGMPEYVQEDETPWKSLTVNFRNADDYAAFGQLLEQGITTKTRSVWFPPYEKLKITGQRRYRSHVLPEHPIYVVSKGRSDRCLTSRVLQRLGAHHSVIVETDEESQYERRLHSPYVAIEALPVRYQRDYEACDELGASKSLGPGPARNFAWDHATDRGAEWHWVMDDNIDGFFRLNRNVKVPADAAVLAAMETFCGRYENVAMGGPSYHGFTHQREQRPPYFLNTRIYSCNLIRNDTPYRWRGRYNEDTDLSLRMLKDGWVTVQFNAFLQKKRETQTMKGGNNADFYVHEGTRPKSEMLVRLHPDRAKLIERWGRPHHFVDYSGFTQTPKLRPDWIEGGTSDEFGMVYEEAVA